MIADLSAYKVVYGEQVVKAVALVDIAFKDKDIDATRKKPTFIEILVINEDGNIEAIRNEAWKFQFIPILHRQEITEDDLKLSYNKGLEDAWKLVTKMFGYSSDTKLSCEDLKKIFGSSCEMDILRNFTPQEALAKLEAYEKEQEEIKVVMWLKV